MKASFFPSVEDSIYIANRIQNLKKSWTLSDWLFIIFLFLNGIGVPAVLWILDHFAIGTTVFAFNLLYYVIFLSEMNKNAIEKYYRDRAAEFEKDPVEIELTKAGIVTSCDGINAIIPWRKIKHLEASDSSIYYFFEDTGLAVRKSAFKDSEEAEAFLAFSKQNAAGSHAT